MITGSMVALVTPMHVNGQVDWSALRELVDWHIAEGSDAIVAVGTSGESPTLSMTEHMQVIEEVVRRAAGKLPVIAGTGANSTAEAIELTVEAERLGANASLQVVPYYNKPTQEGIFQHFKAIAESVNLPIILYNVPGRTVADLLPETVLRLSEITNVVGIKEATGDLDRAKQILELVDSSFAVYSGDDGTAAELILLGGKGNISVTANIIPAEMSQLCAKALSGDAVATRDMNARLADLHDALFIEANPIPVKWALEQMQRIESGVRLPLTNLSTDAQLVLRAQLERLNLL